MSASLNRDQFDQLVRTIADGRHKSEAEVRAAIDRGPLLPEDALLSSLPRLDLGAEEALRLGRGQGIERNEACAPGLVRVYGPGREFLGMAEVLEAGLIVPRRLRRSPALAAARASASIA